MVKFTKRKRGKQMRKINKMCSFYVNDWHLTVMMLPYINGKLQENEKVNLYDVNGHLLSSFVLNDTKQINAPTQPGLYFVRIGNSKSIKLIVTK